METQCMSRILIIIDFWLYRDVLKKRVSYYMTGSSTSLHLHYYLVPCIECSVFCLNKLTEISSFFLFEFQIQIGISAHTEVIGRSIIMSAKSCELATKIVEGPSVLSNHRTLVPWFTTRLSDKHLLNYLSPNAKFSHGPPFLTFGFAAHTATRHFQTGDWKITRKSHLSVF